MCDVTAAVVAGTAIAGAAAASSSKKGGTTTTTQTSTPWQPQAAGLSAAYTEARQNYDNALIATPWEKTQPTTVNFNQDQFAAADYASNYAKKAGVDNGTVLGDSARVLGSQAQPFVGNAGALAQNGAGTANGTAAGVLSTAANGGLTGTTGVQGQAGLAGQMGALGTAQGLAAQGQTNLNPSIQQAAAGYMNSDLTNSQVDAATRDVARNLGEDVLPGLNARAVAGGNINSARAGVAEGIARRGAEDRAADISSTIRNNAYNTGINAALTANSQQNSLALGANGQAAALGGALSGQGENARQFDQSTRLQGATTLGTQDTANRALDANTRISANAQLGNATGMGFTGALTAGQVVGQNSDAMAAAGGIRQAYAQTEMNNGKDMYYADENRRKAALQDYFGIVGNGYNGAPSNTGTSTAPDTPANPLGGAIGGAMMGYGMMSGGSGAGIGTMLGGGGSVGSYGPNSMNGAGAMSYGALYNANLGQNPALNGGMANSYGLYNRAF